MRQARIVEERAAYYHVISRVVDRRYVFHDDLERERVRKIMRAVEGFCGVQILTWVCLSNHIHILLHVPERQYIADTEFMRRMLFLYDQTMVEKLMVRLSGLREAGQAEAAETLKGEYSYRMYSLAEFMKTLKQRISFSYNRRHQRVGTLWEERYKSVLVDGAPGVLSAMAAYIDLNPVRAKMVADAKDYWFSGYGEAMGGSKQAREGLVIALGEVGDWSELAGRYRQLIYMSGQTRGIREDGRAVRPGFSVEAEEGVVALKGKLPLNEILRCRVRYFTDGAILGSRAFVEDAFLRHREHFSVKRETGARQLKGAEFGDMCAARQLRVDVISDPAPT